MKTKIISMTIAVLLLGTLGGAGTYAWYTSKSVSSGNAFDVGSLEVSKVVYGETPTPLFSTSYNNSTWNQLYAVGQWYPGKIVSGKDRSLTVHNTGSLQAKIIGVSARMNQFVTPDDQPDYNGAFDSFTSNMIITVKVAGEEYYRGTLKDLLISVQPLNTPIILDPDPGLTIDLDFEAELSTSAGNLVQGVEASVDLIIHSTQSINSALTD